MGSDPRFNWRKTSWTPSMGRGGYVPRWVKRLPFPVQQKMCSAFGHPLEAIEPFTWRVGDRLERGHLCIRCFGRVDLRRICTNAPDATEAKLETGRIG